MKTKYASFAVFAVALLVFVLDTVQAAMMWRSLSPTALEILSIPCYALVLIALVLCAVKEEKRMGAFTVPVAVAALGTVLALLLIFLSVYWLDKLSEVLGILAAVGGMVLLLGSLFVMGRLAFRKSDPSPKGYTVYMTLSCVFAGLALVCTVALIVPILFVGG